MKGFSQILLLAALMVASRPALSAAEPAKLPAKPNILFAVADDWSFGHAGAYGCKWIATPAMDRVARDGLLFNQAYTPNAKCSPSRASIVTGRNPWQLKAAGNHWSIFPPEFKSYQEALAVRSFCGQESTVVVVVSVVTEVACVFASLFIVHAVCF